VALELLSTLRPRARLAAFSVPGNHDYAEYSVWGVFQTAGREGEAGAVVAPAPMAGARQMAAYARKVLRNELVRIPVAFNDVAAWDVSLRSIGIEPLVNRAAAIDFPGGRMWVIGVDDHTEGRPDLSLALRDVPDGQPLLALAHNPDAWLEPAIQRADLVLAGHTHGGQIRLPVMGAVHTQGTHLTRQHPSGWFRRGETWMFVSRGVGESIPLRIGAPPQAALITLRPLRPD
jgi:hypothetical protein